MQFPCASQPGVPASAGTFSVPSAHRNLIDVHVLLQVMAQRSHITDAQHVVARELMLDAHIELLDLLPAW